MKKFIISVHIDVAELSGRIQFSSLNASHSFSTACMSPSVLAFTSPFSLLSYCIQYEDEILLLLSNLKIFQSLKVPIDKDMVSPSVVYGCESWTIKKAECWKIDALELRCWRRLLRVPWTARKSNQLILKEINLEYSLEGLMLKQNSNTLATWCEELTHWKRPWCWERLKAGGEGDDRGWDGWMASPIQWTWVWANSRRWWRTGKPGVAAVHRVAKSQTLLSDCTELNMKLALLNTY